MVICVEDKIGENELRRVIFCNTTDKGDILQKIEAERGVVTVDEEAQELKIRLFD